MKTRKRIMAVVVAVAMLLTLLPTMAFAANATTLKINRVDMLDGVERSFGEGTAQYDSFTNTLTLTNVTIDYDDKAPEGGSYGQSAIYISGDLNIKLVGENIITSNYYGIWQNSGTLKIIGSPDDSLEITTNGNDSIRAQNIIISGCKLNAFETANIFYSGVYATDKLTIEKNAVVTATNSGKWGYSLMGENSIEISDSEVYATTTAEESNSIFSRQISIKDSVVEANAESAVGYCAIQSEGGIEIEKSTVTANSVGDVAIYTPANIEINDNSIIEATGRYMAIRGVTGTNITNSEVVAKAAEDVAIYADSNNMTINNSIIKATTNNKDTIACGKTVNATIQNSWIENYGGAIRETVTLENVVNFQDDEGEIIGNAIVPKNVTISEDKTLVIEKNEILTIPTGITLTNNGIIDNYGTIENNGTLINNGIIRNRGDINGNEVTGDGNISKPDGTIPQKTLTFDTNGGSKINSVTENYGKTIVLADYAPKRDGYKFLGWYKDKELKEKIEYAVLDYDMTVYAKWEKIEEAVDYDTMVVLTINDKTAVVNGKNVTTDVAPLIVNSRTYTPARFVAESLGAKVEWSPSAKTATIVKDDINIVLAIESNIAYVNGAKVQMDAAAFIADGRTYTPARFVAEQLGATVEWDEEARTVTILK